MILPLTGHRKDWLERGGGGATGWADEAGNRADGVRIAGFDGGGGGGRETALGEIAAIKPWNRDAGCNRSRWPMRRV